MLYKFFSSTLVAAMVIFTISCQQPVKTESQMENEYSGTVPGQQALTPASPEHVAKRLGSFAPFTLTADISHLSAKEKQILSILFDVADIMDTEICHDQLRSMGQARRKRIIYQRSRSKA
jgi:secreted Zn-dependent insulinase-like peptidase